MVGNINGEIWKDIKGYEGIYEVSNFGRVKSLPKKWISNNGGVIVTKEFVMKPGINSPGYKFVGLSKNKVRKNHSIHRLLGVHFIHNPENKSTINHINGIKTDNRLENLEWCTNSENRIHSYKIGLQAVPKGGDHHRSKKIKCMTLDIIFGCAREASEILGLDEGSVYNVAKNIQLHTQGLVFQYI